MIAIRSGRSNGKSRHRVAYVLMKVVFATPIASASVRMAPAVTHPFLARMRHANRRSAQRSARTRGTTDVAARLFDLIESAGTQSDLAAHIGFRFSAADAVCDFALEVVAQFGVEFALERVAPEHAAPQGHRDSPAVLRIRPIASVNRSQLAASSFSWRRPFGVRR